MKDLAIYMRFLQLFAHNCHNMVSKVTFFSDHEFLGSIYSQAEGFYDNIIERMVGLGDEPDLIEIQLKAVNLLKEAKYNIQDNRACFMVILNIIKEMLGEIEDLSKTSLSQGTLQLIGTIADLQEVNVYKLKRRLKE